MTAAATVCNQTLRFALVAYRLGPAQQCAVRCDAACQGYGDINATHCALCTADPRDSPTIDGTEFENTTFSEWVPQTKQHAGCHASGQCLACPAQQNITVTSNTKVYLSSKCTHFSPHGANTSGFAVRLNVVPGARNVEIHGRGTILSDTWPLAFGTPLLIAGGDLGADAEPTIVFSPPGNATGTAAIQVTSAGKVQVVAAAPRFRTLVIVAGMNAGPIKIHKDSYVQGYAREAIAGLGHVTGHITLACLNATGVGANVAGGQHYVVQEIRHDQVKVALEPGTQCTEINLARLLGFYGAEYEQMFFDDYDRDDPPWRAVRIAGTVAATLVTVLLLNNQPAFSADAGGG